MIKKLILLLIKFGSNYFDIISFSSLKMFRLIQKVAIVEVKYIETP
jgi:hypothetical protein